jgi:hypothetical protein
MVESQPSKLLVAGPIPVSRSIFQQLARKAAFIAFLSRQNSPESFSRPGRIESFHCVNCLLDLLVYVL